MVIVNEVLGADFNSAHDAVRMYYYGPTTEKDRVGQSLLLPDGGQHGGGNDTESHGATTESCQLIADRSGPREELQKNRGSGA